MFATAHRRRPASVRARYGVSLAVLLTMLATVSAPADAQTSDDLARRTLDGSNNNLRNPTWGQANTQYTRVAEARYADGIAEPVSGADPRYVSNRIFNDAHQNLFSENGVSQWGFVWGQFMDHTFGLREIEGEDAPLPFDSNDPIEEFENDLGAMNFIRTPAAPGTGVTTPRQQINTVSSYIDGHSVYGSTQDRLDWLREDDSAKLMLPDGDLPTVTARGDASTAPPIEIDGRLRANPDRGRVAGDIRANENIALQATHTLFAREHNRVVDELPGSWPEDLKFEVARRVVGAEQQYITYNEFLPALGLELDRYRGYNRSVNASLSNEFAVVGYRAHSFVHGELEPIGDVGDYTQEELEAIEAQGIEVEIEGDEVEFVIPLSIGFFNPDLVPELGLDAVMRGLGGEPQYKNDEQIDNQLRSVLFQIPVSGNPECLDGPELPECFDTVLDLGAIDIERARDHGLPSYNDLREAYGLPRLTSFTAITGEDTEELPPGLGIDDPEILDFVELRDADGNVIPLDSEEAESDAVEGTRRTTLAARLKAIYGEVDNVDAFVGMLSEAHLAGSEFGGLQHAIWKTQFEALRDGDRFFHATDSLLPLIRLFTGVDHRRTLAEIIVDNTDLEPGDIQDNVFLAAEESG